MSNWIDVSCLFASGVSEADLKAFLPSTVFMENGFLCPSSGAFTNEELSNVFTGLIGLQAKQLDNAPTNQDFFDCMWESFLCDRINERVYMDSVSSNGGPLTLTLPAGGSWCYKIDFMGAADAEFSAVGGFMGQFSPREDNPDNDVSYAGTTSGQAAGGTQFTTTQPADGFATKSIVAWRKDCP